MSSTNTPVRAIHVGANFAHSNAEISHGSFQRLAQGEFLLHGVQGHPNAPSSIHRGLRVKEVLLGLLQWPPWWRNSVQGVWSEIGVHGVSLSGSRLGPNGHKFGLRGGPPRQGVCQVHIALEGRLGGPQVGRGPSERPVPEAGRGAAKVSTD